MGGRGSRSLIPSSSGNSAQFANNALGIAVADNLKDAIGTKGAPKSMGDAMIATNPYYSPDYKEYSENCQRVVVAYEARRRGYDVTALPTYRGDTLGKVSYVDNKNNIARGKWMGAFKNAKPVDVSSTARGAKGEKAVLSNIDKQMASYGNGSRGVVQIFYKNGGGHVFNVERQNGKTHYIEAQSGKVKNMGEVMSHVKTGRVALVRTDNLQLSDRAKNFVTKASKGR